MTWQRAPVAAALVTILAAVDDSVPAFAVPPDTFNPPAYIVGYPRTVNYRTPQFGVDEAQLPLAVACGVAEVDRVDDLLRRAYDALSAATATDPTLGGTVLLVDPGPQDNWRLLKVAGVDVLAADLLLRVLM
jgi:hypothetical protein